MLSFLLAGGHFAGGVLQAVTGGDWDDLTPTSDVSHAFCVEHCILLIPIHIALS